jgi:hypothetical protein
MSVSEYNHPVGGWLFSKDRSYSGILLEMERCIAYVQLTC